MRMGFRIGPTETPIVPVIIGEQDRLFRFWKALFEGGLFTQSRHRTGRALPGRT